MALGTIAVYVFFQNIAARGQTARDVHTSLGSGLDRGRSAFYHAMVLRAHNTLTDDRSGPWNPCKPIPFAPWVIPGVSMLVSRPYAILLMRCVGTRRNVRLSSVA